MRLVTAILARNEADRYLARVLNRCAEFSDQILLLDDNSTDNTVEVARAHGCLVRSRFGPEMWGREASARQELWEWGAEEAGDGWLLICDADQILHGDVKPLTETWVHNAWSMPLFDCWDSETTFRADGYWQGYQHPRAWLFRPGMVTPGWQAEWPARGMHTGHAPANFPLFAGIAPVDVYWQHLGWVKPEDRAAKYDLYMREADQLTPFERAHVESIRDAQYTRPALVTP